MFLKLDNIDRAKVTEMIQAYPRTEAGTMDGIYLRFTEDEQYDGWLICQIANGAAGNEFVAHLIMEPARPSEHVDCMVAADEFLTATSDMDAEAEWETPAVSEPTEPEAVEAKRKMLESEQENWRTWREFLNGHFRWVQVRYGADAKDHCDICRTKESAPEAA